MGANIRYTEESVVISKFIKLFMGLAITGSMIVNGLHAENRKPESLKKASAFLNPTKGNKSFGIVTFTEVEGGAVKIEGDVEGLVPGKHGFHIHEYGDCSAPDGSSTGGHFNPTGTAHGSPDHAERHIGDLGNIVADEAGRGHYERLDTHIKLSGPNTIMGRSLVVHSNADDYSTQPTGNAGGRVCCGVIMD